MSEPQSVRSPLATWAMVVGMVTASLGGVTLLTLWKEGVLTANAEAPEMEDPVAAPPAVPSWRRVPHCASPEIFNAAYKVLTQADRYATMHRPTLIEAEDAPLRRVCRALVIVGASKEDQHWMRYTVERAGSEWFIQFSAL